MFSEEKLLKILSGKEYEPCEFKKAKSNYNTTKCLEYCTGIANFGGGYLIFGVEDKTKEVVGSNAFENTNDIKKKILEKIHIIVKSYEYFLDSKRVLVLEIPSHPAGRFNDLDGQYFLRNGESLVKMSWDQLQEEASKVIPDYSAEIVDGASINDLDKGSFLNFMAHPKVKDNLWNPKKISFHEYLKHLRLSTSKGITVAALVMFGSKDSIEKFMPQAETIVEYRSDPNSIDTINRIPYRHGFIDYLDIISKGISSFTGSITYSSGTLFRPKLDIFNKGVIREALLNAFCHRDYSDGRSIIIKVSAKELIINNPGGFPKGITAKNIIDEQNPRNRLIAESLQRWELVERAGQGYNRMWESSILEAKHVPDISNTTKNQFSLKLNGSIINKSLLEYMTGKHDVLRTLSIHQLIAIHNISLGEKPKIETRKLNKLLESNLIEKTGYGSGTRYSLPKEYFVEKSTKAKYTKAKGLSDAKNRELILRHINDFNKANIQELEDALGIKRRRIHTLLNSLRVDGLIKFEGSKRSGVWMKC